jgi:DNA invertase Pin-like site-specific DNA recombinase
MGVNYKSFTEPYPNPLGPFGDVIVSLLATIAAQDLIKISENTKVALAKKKATGVKLGTPGKSQAQIEQIRWRACALLIANPATKQFVCES